MNKKIRGKLLYLEELLLAINRREDNKEIHEKIM